MSKHREIVHQIVRSPDPPRLRKTLRKEILNKLNEEPNTLTQKQQDDLWLDLMAITKDNSSPDT